MATEVRRPAPDELADAGFRTMIEHSSDAIILLAADGIVLYANPSTHHVLGVDPVAIVGRNAVDFIPPAEVPTLKEQFAALTQQPDRPVVIEHGYHDPSGVGKWLQSTVTSLLDEPSLGAIVANVRDVTERRRADERRERLLHERQALLDAAVEAVFGMDLEGRCTFLNPRAVALFGYTPEECFGKVLHDLIHYQRPDGTHFPHAECPMHLAFQDGASLLLREEIYWRKDGTPLPALCSLSPVKERGVVTGAMLTVVDVTELRQAEQRLRFLAEASVLLASSLDYHTTLTRVARLAVPALADWCIVYLRQDDGSILRLALEHADPTRAALAAEIQNRFRIDPNAADGVPAVMRSGTSQFVPEVTPALLASDVDEPDDEQAILDTLQIRSWMGIPLTAHGRTFGAISFVTAESNRVYTPADLALAEDLARRAALAIDNARLYLEAQEAVRARDQFLSIAAHELRTPVTAIKGLIQLMRHRQARGTLDTDRLTDSLVRLGDMSERLIALMTDLLDVSQIRLGHLPLRLRPVDLVALIGDVVERLEASPNRRHELTIQAEDRSGPVRADQNRIEQVLTNLLENAIKYSPDGGIITITLSADGDGVHVAVTDQGIGLPTGAADTIFEPFGRAANATARNLPGLGLGLHLCRNIIERHDGRIWAESPGEDRGTTMHLWLPVSGSGTADLG